MNDQEKSAMDRIAELVPQMTPQQQEKLSYICEGIALACEGQKDEAQNEEKQV